MNWQLLDYLIIWFEYGSMTRRAYFGVQVHYCLLKSFEMTSIPLFNKTFLVWIHFEFIEIINIILCFGILNLQSLGGTTICTYYEQTRKTIQNGALVIVNSK